MQYTPPHPTPTLDEDAKPEASSPCPYPGCGVARCLLFCAAWGLPWTRGAGEVLSWSAPDPSLQCSADTRA